MKTLKIRLRLIAAIGSLALAAVAQQTSSIASSAPSSPNGARVPQLVNYSGALTDINGKALAGVVGVTFALYQDAEGGAPLWAETQNIQPMKSGHYTVMLGSTSSTGLPQDVFVTGEARWLGVQVEGQAEAPRVLLVAPAMSGMDPARRAAFATNERSANTPTRRSRHASGCGCCSGTTLRAETPPRATRTQPGRRPWMLGH
jgi:hypothetical protein